MESAVPLSELAAEDEVKNIVIFISDSTRFDKVPDAVTSRGLSSKAISPSTFTAPSLPSIITGQYPVDHGVWRFKERLAKRPFLIDSADNFGFNLDTMWVHIDKEEQKPPLRILWVNPSELRASVSELDEPFVYIVHDRGGHAPYGEKHLEWESTSDFFAEYRNKPKKIHRMYEQSLSSTAKRFKSLLDELEDAGKLERTLLVFTSDHGELLGEKEYGGLYAHHAPLVPELVTVPIVFAGAGLPTGDYESLLSGLDILPTVLSAQSKQLPPDLQGADVWETSPSNTNRFIRSDVCHGGRRAMYTATSAWQEEGGICVHRSGLLNRLAYLITHDIRGSRRQATGFGEYAQTAKWYLPQIVQHQTPSIETSVRTDLPTEFNRDNNIEPSPSAPTQEQLERLGYLE